MAVTAMTFLAGIVAIFCLIWFAIISGVIVVGLARKKIYIAGLLSTKSKSSINVGRIQSLLCTIALCLYLIYYGIIGFYYLNIQFPDLPLELLFLSLGSHGILIGASAVAQSRATIARRAGLVEG